MKLIPTLEDVCNYFPHGVRYTSPNDEGYGFELSTIDNVGQISSSNLAEQDVDVVENIEDVTFILRPISQMFQIIEHDGETFIPIERLAKAAIKDFKLDKIAFSKNQDENKTSGAILGTTPHIDILFAYDLQRGFFIQYQDSAEQTPDNTPELKQMLHKWHFWLGDQDSFNMGLIIIKKAIKYEDN